MSYLSKSEAADDWVDLDGVYNKRGRKRKRRYLKEMDWI